MLGDALETSLDELCGMSGEDLEAHRYRKFRIMGSFFESADHDGPPNSK